MVGIVGYNFCIIEAVVDHVTSYFGFFSSLKFFDLVYCTIYYSSWVFLTMVFWKMCIRTINDADPTQANLLEGFLVVCTYLHHLFFEQI